MLKKHRIFGKVGFNLFLILFPIFTVIFSSSPSLAQSSLPQSSLAKCRKIGGKKICVKVKDLDPTIVIPGSAKVSEAAWGEAGAVGYQAALKIMSQRNGSGQYLDETQKRFLRPFYGDLVDQVGVAYNSKMMSEWNAFGKSINLGGVASAAQTFCNSIYISDSYKPNDRSQLILLAHEMRHSQQCRELGGASGFGRRYFVEYKKANQNYENNRMEKEAENLENEFARSLPKSLIASSSTSQPEEELNRPRLIPLALYWNGQREDNSTVATLAMRRSQEQSGYAGPNIQGCIFSQAETGTIPLLLFWHQQRQDNATVATSAAIQSQRDSGYGNPAIQGYIYPNQQPGTIPLYLFWHQQREDNATVATSEMIQSQRDSGYGNPAIQGYIYPAGNCR